ncbi:unnamed protein product [Echinostoma caproni]|uniref:SERPIN domain-containing protein n=1 Tax=Echinostoma caproni TaxID=27848 RepID=A0A183AQZ5_9TREM|nr:unnamed protein product [Echinostoma caproni]
MVTRCCKQGYCDENTLPGYKYNVFISPVSIYAAMAMVLAGSEGETKREILSALRLPTDIGDEEIHNAIGSFISSCFQSTPGVTVSVGNRGFAEREVTLASQYQEILNKNYGVDFRGAIEAVRKHINDWVSSETKGKIQNLFAPDSLDSKTCVILINTLYFKGAWEKEFDKELTTQMEFHLLNGQKKNIQMMYKKKQLKFASFPDLDAAAIKMPFRQSKGVLRKLKQAFPEINFKRRNQIAILHDLCPGRFRCISTWCILQRTQYLYGDLAWQQSRAECNQTDEHKRGRGKRTMSPEDKLI